MPEQWTVEGDDGNAHESSQLWLVRVTEERSTTFWVEAPNRGEAEDAAEALAGDIEDWEEFRTDTDVMHAQRIRQRPLNDDLLWVGGEQGDWVLCVVPGEEATA